MKKKTFEHLTSKRNVAVLTSLFLFTSSGQAALATDSQSYTDIPNHHWAASAIERLSEYELVNGYNGKYQPTASITRGELAVIIDRTMKYHEKSNSQFSDLRQAFFTDAILRAAYTGVMQGDGEQIRPLDNVSRQEAITMLARAFGISPAEGNTAFADDAAIASWAKGYVRSMQDQSYVKGNNNLFNPTQDVTRAEVAQVLDSLIGQLYSQAGTYNDSVNGNVIINSPDVVLKDTLIKKNLIIAEGVADGDVTLENVTVAGNTIIRGGGDHSVHVTGNSELGAVILEKMDSAVRISLTDQAKTGTISINDGAEGVKVDIDKEASADTIKTQVKNTVINNQGTVNKIEIAADHASVNSNNAVISVAEDLNGVTVNNKQVQGGSTLEVNNTSTTDTSGDQNRQTTSSSSSVSGSTSSIVVPHTPVATTTSTSTTVPTPTPTPEPVPVPTVDPLQIVSIETVTNGRVKLTLNQATETALTKSNISIICTSGGKDMTVLDVRTTDNKNYDIITAYYDDNTYSLAIMQDDKVVHEKEFVSKYDCPAITSTEVIRETADTAEFTYVSDISGEFYYMVSKNEQRNVAWANPMAAVGSLLTTIGHSAEFKTLSVWSQPAAPTAEQIMESGTSTAMKNGLNTIQINQLEQDTPYTLYYVAKGIDNKVTPVKSISIAAQEVATPAQNDISITKFEAFETDAKELTDVLGGFRFTLSRPTEQKLTADAIVITCPAHDDITLGRLETTDNQNYTIYMKAGYMFADRNTYTVNITFPDQTVATSKTYVDLTAPQLTGVTITRKSENAATVQFTANEAGYIYWKGLNKSQTSDLSFKDPKTITEGGTKVAIREGGIVLEITGIASTNAVFGYVTEDELGNQTRTYYYNSIPNYEKAPTVEKEPTGDKTPVDQKPSTTQENSGKVQTPEQTEGLSIQSIEVTTDEDWRGQEVVVLDVTLAQETNYMVSNQNVVITGNNVRVEGYRYISVESSGNTPNKFSVQVSQQLDPGTYTLELTLGGQTAKKEFKVS